MPTALITGSSGFFGGILKRKLLQEGWRCISIDLVRDEDRHPQLISIQGDIRNTDLLRETLSRERVDSVFHCAAILAHAVKDKAFLWSSNVEGTRAVAGAMREHGISTVVFTSSNCLWGGPLGRPVTEEDAPDPAEIYGRSKWEGEKILLSTPGLRSAVIRCPTIIDAGRLGLLSILFAFIDEGRRVWTVGGGGNRYQWIYAENLSDACIRAAEQQASGVFNVGSDDVPTLRECYESVIRRAQSGARVASLPRTIAIPVMKIAHALKLSPLGPYQYKMIAEDFAFDTSKIKRTLGWRPTLGNAAMLWKAYEYYRANRRDLRTGPDIPAHRQPAKMGVIRVLKWFS